MVNPITRFVSRIIPSRTATLVYKKQDFSSQFFNMTGFGDYESRLLRYQVYWAMYENTAYDDLHKWSQAMRSQHGLSKLIRGIYNPVYRLSEFWVSHIWGGQYDLELGDGEFIPTSLPLAFGKKAKEDKIKNSLINVFDWSNWQVNKDLVPLYGSVMGDVFVKVVDDPEKKRISYEVVHPGKIVEYTSDSQGNIKSYVLEEPRIDPEDEKGEDIVVYREEVKNEGGMIEYATLKDGKEYAWHKEGSQWSVNYGFCPIVLIQHKNVGQEWGWAEHHALKTKFMNLDDVATNVSDFVRINVNSPWLLAGVKKPKNTPRATTPATPDGSANRYPIKDDKRVLYGPTGATAQEMISKLELEGTLGVMKDMLEEIERDYPELSMDIWNVSGEQSARALRIARQKTEKKAEQRRTGYDDGHRRINMMACSMGAMKKYPGFEGLTPKSYETGQLTHYIGRRPVFVVDELEDLEIEEAFWKAAIAATEAGMSLEVWLSRKGWTPEEINKWKESEDYQLRMKLRTLALEQPVLKPGADQGGRPEDKTADRTGEGDDKK